MPVASQRAVGGAPSVRVMSGRPHCFGSVLAVERGRQLLVDALPLIGLCGYESVNARAWKVFVTEWAVG
jgi:hypothetical protein